MTLARARLDPASGQAGSVSEHAIAESVFVYDPAYLEVAVRRDLPLATLDRELARAAQAEQVALIGAETHSIKLLKA
jgi:predicted nucleic acid-binding protein